MRNSVAVGSRSEQLPCVPLGRSPTLQSYGDGAQLAVKY
jgi:hypothetical protein